MAVVVPQTEPRAPGERAEATLARYVHPREVRAFVPGNQVRFLRDGGEAYPEMLAAIAGAKRFVHLETFIFGDDSTGHRFARALAQAAERGVEVTVLYDAIGSWRSHSGFFRALRRRGVRARAFSPVWPWPGFVRLFRRDHRKLLAVDGEVAFVGGINISDAWATRAEGGQEWRDDVMRIDGPAVAELVGLFRATWRTVVGALAKGQPLPRSKRGLPSAPKGESAVAIFAARRAIHLSYLRAIDSAQRTVFIAASYFVPDQAILRALHRARKRGVEVALLLPARSDHYSVLLAGRALYGSLLRRGVRIHEWQERILHAKTAVVDAVWGTMGSFNLDRWSLHFSHELNAVFCDPTLGAELNAAFVRDLAASRVVTLEMWKARSRVRRVLEWFFSQFARWM